MLDLIRTPPRHSLHLITHVLGASANWVILRYLAAALGSKRRRQDRDSSQEPYLNDDAADLNGAQSSDSVPVVLVSWLHDLQFWKTEAKRSCGIDLQRLQQQGLLTFIDALTSASTEPPSPTETPLTTLYQTLAALPPTNPPPLLILDAPTFLLQAGAALTARDLSQQLLRLRALVHAAVVCVPADAPLVSPAAAALESAVGGGAAVGLGTTMMTTTPLEVETAAFVVATAYQADRVVACRRLETGWARDVSGVVRVSRGGGGSGLDGGVEDAIASKSSAEDEQGEWLYFVAGDGGVKVWKRGAAEM